MIPRSEEKLDILPRLERRFRRWLRADLVGAHIVQVDNLVYLEEEFQPRIGINDKNIHRTDLSFISDDMDAEGPAFPPSNSIEKNSEFFLETDTYTIHYLFNLFSSEANEYIDRLHKYQDEIPFSS